MWLAPLLEMFAARGGAAAAGEAAAGGEAASFGRGAASFTNANKAMQVGNQFLGNQQGGEAQDSELSLPGTEHEVPKTY